MGVDISLFNKTKQTRVHLDRYWVFNPYDTENKDLEDLIKLFRDHTVGLDMFHMEWMLDLLRDYHSREEQDDKDRYDYAVYWIEQAREFVKQNPDDVFFGIHDHDDLYFDILREWSK